MLSVRPQNANVNSQNCAGNECLGMAWRLLQELVLVFYIRDAQTT